jgi:microcystin-dependent protein
MEGTMATIMFFAGTFTPKNWAPCNGQLMSIAQNSALFSLLGTTFGGDGRVTFGIPDFRGRAPVGAGSNGVTNYDLGEVAGSETQTLLTSNLPPHTHTMAPSLLVANVPANTEEPGTNLLAQTAAYYNTGGASGGLGGVTSTPTGFSGASAPFSIRTPYLGMNFVICTAGIYPSRN